MQQKIQFIGSLLHDPGLIVMDEPFSGLDPVNAQSSWTPSSNSNQGSTIVFSTHRMDQVEKLCDSICLIHNGHLVLSGSMREIKSRYPNNRVHMTFEGDASFLNHPSIEEVRRYSGRAEIKLRDGPPPIDPGAVGPGPRSAAATCARIYTTLRHHFPGDDTQTGTKKTSKSFWLYREPADQ